MAWIALALAPLLWAGNFVLGKTLADALPPFTLSLVRWALGAIVMLPLVLPRRRELLPPRDLWLGLTILAITGVFLYSALVYAALPETVTVNAALIQAAIPLVTLLLAIPVLSERPRAVQWLGVATAFAGVAWIVGGGRLETLAALQVNRGDALMLANAVVWAVYTIVAQRVLPRMGNLAATFVSVLIGLPFLLAAAAVEMQGRAWPPITAELAVAILYIAIFPSIVAYLLWNHGVAVVGAGRAALFTNLLPLYTAFLAWLFLAEPVEVHHVAGGLAIAGGVYLGVARRVSSRR